MTYLAHVAPVSSIPSPEPAAAILAVAEALQPDLAQGLEIDALRLWLEIERAFGGSDADGAWDWKLAYEAGEVALVLFLRKFGRALLARAGSPAALLPILTKVSDLLPTHTRRSEEVERFPQFSTPLPMGLAALAVAQISARDLVLEPSAGTGLLAILAEIAGGSLALNELAETRAEILRLLFPGRPVTGFDAAQIDDHLDASVRPSVILMNPPFSAVVNVDGSTTEATARHLRSALARLAPGGRLVAITGASFAPDAPAWADTFTRLRASELLAVRMGDFPEDSFSSVRVLGKGRRERVLPLWKEIQAAIRAWLAFRPGTVGPELFLDRDGRRMTRDGFAYRLRLHVATAERSAPSIAAKQVTPHVLRHSCAMHTLQATGDIRKVALWLGHASIQTTEMYLRADPTEKLALLDAHQAPLIKPGKFREPSDKLMQILAVATQRS